MTMPPGRYERALEPTIEMLGLPPGASWPLVSPTDKVAYLKWVHEVEELPEDVRFSLLVWILRSVIAPKEHYGKDADSKPDEHYDLMTWIADRTGLNLEVLVHDVVSPHIEAIQMLKPPITIPKVDP